MDKINVLDKGWIELLDVMPDDMSADLAVVNAARVSYNGESKGAEQDKKLLHYLLKHRHCYDGSMQVLTSSGWKYWNELSITEEFIVPDANTGRYTKEHCNVLSFDYQGPMMKYANSRMSYIVTPEHKMFFKRKYSNGFEKIKAFDIHQGWGHFLQGSGFLSKDNWGVVRNNYEYALGSFVAFYLGDGSYASVNRISFHLKKKRKIEFLESLIKDLGLNSVKTFAKGAWTYHIETPKFLFDFVSDITSRAKDKSLANGAIQNGSDSFLKGLYEGFVNSDGSKNLVRPQIKFSSTSSRLLKQFELIVFLIGYEAHGKNNYVTVYTNLSRTSLEARKQYFQIEENFSGKVYCATTSTGLLIVRGTENSNSFVCGNSSPFEMVEFKFRLRAPLVTFWQLVRHRTFNLNMQSGRYTPFEEDDFYVPTEWRKQAKSNKQASDGVVDSLTDDMLTQDLLDHYNRSYFLYKKAIDNGVAREQARLFLPGFSVYYTAVVKTDAHNLMHFLRLRLAQEAQYEIRVYAEAIWGVFKEVMPWVAQWLIENEPETFLKRDL